MKYPGNKTIFLPELLDLISKHNNSTFIEPFAGSGTVSLSVSQTSVQNILLNDIDYHTFKIHESFKHGSYDELSELIDEIWTFGDPHHIKEDYYTARTSMNEKYYRNQTGNKEGFYYWLITIFAINSLMRFGPNGFNQGWGNRGVGRREGTRSMTRKKFNNIQDAYKKILLSNDDYNVLLNSLDDNSILFVDPPYSEMGSGTYDFSKEESESLIEKIKNWSGPVIYTDVFSEEKLELLGSGWDYKILRKNMGSGKPGKINQKRSESVYTNFKIQKAKFLF